MNILKIFKKIIKAFVPYGIIYLRMQYKNKNSSCEKYYLSSWKEAEIRNYFLSLNTSDSELLQIKTYFENYDWFPLWYPYAFTRNYNISDIRIFIDEAIKMRYVLHENKRLYFPENFTSDNIRYVYNYLCMEQDNDSPHRYESDGFVVQNGDVIADVGAAEGIWALSNVEKASKIYLFECSGYWRKVLEKTFEPWKEKVIIVDKYVSDIDDSKNVKLDTFFKGKHIDYIKADIEGMERKMLEGCREMLSNINVKLVLCTYHSKNDADEIKKILEKNGFKTEYSKGFMLIDFNESLEKPYVRRGLIKGVK